MIVASRQSEGRGVTPEDEARWRKAGILTLPRLNLGGEYFRTKGNSSPEFQKMLITNIEELGQGWEPDLTTYVRECSLLLRAKGRRGGVVSFVRGGEKYEYIGNGNRFEVRKVE